MLINGKITITAIEVLGPDMNSFTLDKRNFIFQEDEHDTTCEKVCQLIISSPEKIITQPSIAEQLGLKQYVVSRVFSSLLKKQFNVKMVLLSGDVQLIQYDIREIKGRNPTDPDDEKSRKYYRAVNRTDNLKEILSDLESDHLIDGKYRSSIDKTVLFLRVTSENLGNDYITAKNKIDAIIKRIAKDLADDAILRCDVSTDYRDGSSILTLVFNHRSSDYHLIADYLFGESHD